MYNPSKDLNAIQKILIKDAKLLALMDLSNASNVEKAKRIIKKSKWDDLVTSEKRLCVYFIPDRVPRNIALLESYIQIDVHVPATLDYKAWEIQERVKQLLHDETINKKCVRMYQSLGELPTMKDFFCCGVRYKFFRTI